MSRNRNEARRFSINDSTQTFQTGVLILTVSLLVILSACGSQVTPTDEVEVDQIIVSPSGLLFTSSGETAQLTAQAYDAQGEPVAAEITWEIRSGPITVDGNGRVTSTANLGSALIVAKAGEINSYPVTVLIAEPAPGTILISDDQVAADPVALEGIDSYGYGWTYQIELRDLPRQPEVGDIVMSRESTPISGRVVAVANSGSTTTVTLELIPVKELFVRLDYNEDIDLAGIRPELSDDLAGLYTISRNNTGGFDFTPTPEGLRTLASPWADGCKVDPGPSGISPPATIELPNAPSFSFSSGLNASLQFDPNTLDFQKLELSGSTSVTFFADFAVKATIQGKVTCDAIIGIVPIPIPPPLMVIFFPHVGLGLGIELSAKVTSKVEFEVFAQSTMTATAGIDCTTTCGPIGPDVNATFDWTVKPTFPGISSDSTGFEFEASAAGFASAKLIFGNPIFRYLRALQLEAVQIKAGVKKTVNLQPKDRQAAQSNYGSNLKLDLFFGVGAGDSIQTALGLLQISIAPGVLKKEFTSNLMQFPGGTTTVSSPKGGSPPIVATGDQNSVGDFADFDVQLTSRDFSIGTATIDLVENVEIFWWKNNTLEPGRPPCTTLNGSGTSFRCSASFLEEHKGDNTFYAFINPEIFGVSIPIPLEVNQDAKIELFVDPPPEITSSVTSNTTTITAETDTDVTYTLPFEDVGENISKITSRFELAGNPNEFTFDWTPSDPDVSGFTGASGNGTVSSAIFVFCSEQGNNPITATFTLTDEFDQVSDESSTTLTVDYSSCPADPASRSGETTSQATGADITFGGQR